MKISVLLTAVFCVVASFASAQDLETCLPHPNPPAPYSAKVDPAIPRYKAVKGLSGTFKGVQSNTTCGVLKLWIDGFTKLYPDVHLPVDVGGSGQAGPRLTNGSAQWAFIARELMGREEFLFTDKFGYKPLQVAVSGGSLNVKAFTDAIVFIVNKDNPLDKLTFKQIDAIYSFTRNRGAKQNITTWGELGLTGDWADKPIHLYGVQIPNGYDTFIVQRVLADGQWRDGIKTDKTVIPLSDHVAADKYALSYTGLAWNTSPGTKVLKLAVHEGDPYHEATFDEVAAQTYPLLRVIYMFANREPGKPMDPVLREFMRYALSQEGQQMVVQDGIFTPLTKELDEVNRKKLE
jgi:phosphate transport system substrate-binding protein